ncbi:MAG TPA: cytochrome P450 [Dehalococcoidia bacterium]|nr:cytochrome P450 [Dehalococcoidia bacterium]
MPLPEFATNAVRSVAIRGMLLKERLQSGVAFNPLAAELRENPYPTYARLRTKDPVHRSVLMQCWVLTRQADVMAVMRDPRFAADRSKGTTAQQFIGDDMGPYNRWLANSLLSLDPPDHTRLRALASKAFTPRAVEQMRPRIAQIVDGLLDAVQAQGHMDLIRDLAYPLPVIVIAEMLGVPAEDRPKFKAWSDALGEGLEPLLTPEQLSAADAAVLELSDYFRAIIRERARQPQDDLISALVQAHEGSDKMNEDELYAMCILLLAAGNETTTNLIGNGMLALLRNPRQMARLQRAPAMIENAVEELLRYDSPVQMSGRVAMEDVTIGGQPIKQGEFVAVIFGAANRDPDAFEQPERLDLGRGNIRHLSFGQGIHYCLGAPLARVEGQIAIAELLRRMPGLRLGGRPRWRSTILLRGLQTLPVTFAAQPHGAGSTTSEPVAVAT